MADSGRRSPDPLDPTSRLAREPWSFGFFEALRRIEAAHPSRPGLGRSSRVSEDPVRLAQEPSVAFAPSTLAGWEPARGGRPARLSAYFLGLFGPHGPLPLHITEYARARMRNHDDRTLTRFADVFHHRILSLFYRAWAEARPVCHYDRREKDRFALYVGALMGIGLDAVRGRDAVPDRARLHFAGHLSCPTRHADGLRSILQGFFGVPIEVEQFVGHWIPVPERGRCRLGESARTGALGRNLTVGARVWDCSLKFRVVAGPMPWTTYNRLLPGGESLERLEGLVRGHVGGELLWDLQLILRKEDVPALALGRHGRLGWDTWVGPGARARDAGDLVVDPRGPAGGGRAAAARSGAGTQTEESHG